MSEEATEKHKDFLAIALKQEILHHLVTQKANACPMGVRLAWHSSGTFKKEDGSGGSNGATMRFEPESIDGANAGLGILRDILVPVQKKFPNVSISDIWAMTGVAAVEHCGGPKVPLVLGREDKGKDFCPENGRLPDASQGAQHLRDIFYRMGFNDQEIVTLSGAHTLGRCHKTRSGFDGPWTEDPLKFDNSYFTSLLEKDWQPREWDGPLQYEDAETKSLMMLPTDIALITDDSFKVWVEKYAQDADLFATDFAAVFGKLLALGCPAQQAATPPTPEEIASLAFREHAMHGSLEHCQKAVADGADPKSTEANSGRTALHKAAFWGHAHLILWFVDDLGIEVNALDYNGDTALHDATRFGHMTVIKQLLDSGADPSIVNKDGKKVADVAKDYGKTEIVDMF